MKRVKTESLDHYGLVMGIIKELGIIDVVDKTVPIKSESKIISHGMAVAAMIINSLGYANKQLYLTPRFFEKKAIGQLFEADIKAEHFNKDTLGRTLDRIFEYGVSELYEKIAKKALDLEKATKIHTPLENSFHIVVESSFPIPMESRIHTLLENKIPIHLDGSNLLSI